MNYVNTGRPSTSTLYNTAAPFSSSLWLMTFRKHFKSSTVTSLGCWWLIYYLHTEATTLGYMMSFGADEASEGLHEMWLDSYTLVVSFWFTALTPHSPISGLEPLTSEPGTRLLLISSTIPEADGLQDLHNKSSPQPLKPTCRGSSL